ncbi:MAG: CHRD domain-containing protein [Chthonomonadetes bacterium]|nr:CHRD domain-containing protein [Chthonomonadetes bacterium]
MKKFSIRFAVLMALLSLIALPSSAGLWYLQATLTGSQEVPPVSTNASGVLFGSYDDVTKTINLAISITGLSQGDITGSHIHRAPIGVNGPVIFNIGNGSSYAALSGQLIKVIIGAPFPAAEEANLLSGNTYINVHTTAYPGGEIRGQITALPVVPEPATMAGLGIGVGLLALRRRRR